MQLAWRSLNVPQCGYCQSGQIMQAASLLATTPSPTDEQIDAGHARQYLPVRDLPPDPRGDP